MIQLIARFVICAICLAAMSVAGSFARMLFIASNQPFEGFIAGFQSLMMFGAGALLTIAALSAFCLAVCALTDPKFPTLKD